MRNERLLSGKSAPRLLSGGRLLAAGRWFLAITVILTSVLASPVYRPASSVSAQGSGPGITVSPISGLTTSEDGQKAQFRVWLNSQPGLFETVRVRLESSNPAEGTPSTSMLSFHLGNWDDGLQVTVNGVNDDVKDGNINYSIHTLPSTSNYSSSPYNGIDAADVSLVNLDNDNDQQQIVVTAQGDSYSTSEGKTLNQPAPGVLANDSTTGNNITAELVSSVSHGTLNLNGNGGFSYTPSPGYSGPDSFVYRAKTASVYSTPVVVSLTVTFELRVTALPDTYSTSLGVAINQGAPGVLANDSTNGTSLIAELASNPSFGTVALAQNGAFVYTPNAGFIGQDSFTYVARSGTAVSGPVSVTINISLGNAAPVATDDQYFTNATNSSPMVIAAPGVLANDNDPEGLPLSVSVVANPQQGSLSLNSNGSFTYTPTSGVTSGTASFTYQVTDSTGQTDTASVNIVIDTVAPPAPTWLQPGADGSTNEVAVGTITLEVTVSPTATDVARVTFYRWDSFTSQRVELGSDDTSPYAITIDSAVLNYEWNQIDAVAVDLAGNHSLLQHIWVLRDLPPVAYLPFIRR